MYRKSNTGESGLYQPITELKQAWQTYQFFYIILPAIEQTSKSMKEILQKQTRKADWEKQKLDLFPKRSGKDRFFQIQFSANEQALISYTYSFS